MLVVPLLTLLLCTANAIPATAARPLALGFYDDVYMSDTAERDRWVLRTAGVGSDAVRIGVGWVAPDTDNRPAGFAPRDPADPNYNFDRADAAIKSATAQGLRVLVSFSRAPRWAEGPNRPASATSGSWRPSPSAVGDYAVALSRRYSGTFPDPNEPGVNLPRVQGFQLWNEPNLSTYLSPQWRRGRAFAPGHYRRMLRSFYSAIKSVRPSALVVTAGTAPFGDLGRRGQRMMPLRFVRELLCVRSRRRRLERLRCPTPARFDVLAHHPYSVGSPRRKALNADDVSIPDMRKLAGVLRFAERSNRALPRKRHRLWVTEVSYDSKPPDPDGLPAAQHARYLQEALYLLWRQSVDTIFWFQVRDQAPDPSYAATNQSGVFLRDGTAKPAAVAFRFPFVVERMSQRSLRAWGRSPKAGVVTIERLRSGTWQTVRSLEVGRHGIFLTRIPSAATPDRLRARVGPEQSLIWHRR